MTSPIVLACSMPDVSAFDLDAMQAVDVGPGSTIRTTRGHLVELVDQPVDGGVTLAATVRRVSG